MDWSTLTEAISGAAIAIIGAAFTDRLRYRHEDARGRLEASDA